MSLTTTGAFLTIVNLFVNIKIKIQTITILNDAVSDTLRNVLTSMLNMVMKNEYILLISGVLLIIVSNLIHNIKKYGLEKENDTYEN